MENLDPHLQRVVMEGNDVSIGAITKDHGVALHRPGQSAHPIPPTTRLLVVLALGRLLHGCAHVLDERVRLPSEEATHIVHALPIVLLVYAANAWRGTLIDIAKQARPPQLRGPLEDSISTRSHSEDLR